MQETNNQQLPALITNPSTVIEQIKEAVPEMKRYSDAAMEAIKNFKKATTDEEFEQNNRFLVRVKATYDKINEFRTPITKQLDELKEFLMQYEKPFSYDSKALSLYNELKKTQSDYQQEKLNRINQEKAEAAKRKAVEDEKVNVATKIRTALSALMMDKLRKFSDWCASYFNQATPDTFKKMEETFTSFTPSLKKDDYHKCFDVAYDGKVLTTEMYTKHVESVKAEETYEKWNAEYVAKLMPTLNEWRGKVPDIKKEMIARFNAQGEEKKRLEEEAAQKKSDEDKRRKEELDRIAADQQRQIDEQAQKDLLHNSFQQQASEQQLDDAGPTKKVLKFVEATNPQALVHILYVVFDNKKFGGILKKDKNDKIVMDAQGRPEYIPQVQWWIDQYLKLCDLDKYKIEKTVIYEDAKTIVRK